MQSFAILRTKNKKLANYDYYKADKLCKADKKLQMTDKDNKITLIDNHMRKKFFQCKYREFASSYSASCLRKSLK